MGILDEAIREHLDLKRSRGADPAEVTRQEHEALGPVRREPAGDEASDEAAPEAPEEAAEPSAGDEPPEPAPAPPEAAEPPPPTAPADVADVAVPFGGSPDLAPSAPVAPEPVKPEPAPAPSGPQETEEWGFEDAEPETAAEPEPEEDVLEETPDFLQETPEHDRLWFEQKPPRDFDFDG